MEEDELEFSDRSQSPTGKEKHRLVHFGKNRVVPVRPILGSMKRPGSARKAGHVLWNEHNLEENEKIKAQLSTVKINEPKTPYHGPAVEEDELDGEMKPLTLDDSPEPSTSHGPSVSEGSHVPKPSEPHPPEATKAEPMYHPALVFDKGLPLEQNDHHGQNDGEFRDGPASESGFSSDYSGHCSGGSGGEDDETKTMKRRRFEAMRRAHYNMKEALLRGKSEDEDEEDNA